ncbi:MAG: hypothetical protein HYW51_02180 [Candidatus Doudnabacteria bacterium]|nr:hypothetical protein [Candidatus Doudnabacteria bacterium]
MSRTHKRLREELEVQIEHCDDGEESAKSCFALGEQSMIVHNTKHRMLSS